MTLFWAGIGAGVAGVGLIVWTMLRAGKACDDWLKMYGPLEWPHHVKPIPARRPYNYGTDPDAWADMVRAEIAALPTTREPAA